MTHRNSRTKGFLGLAVGTMLMTAASAHAQTDVGCYAAVVDLYMAQRSSGALNYQVCKDECRETAQADRAACRIRCQRDRTAAIRGYREDASALRAVCDGDVGAAAQRSSGGPIPASCGTDLSGCAGDVRVSAKICDRESEDLLTLSACAAEVSSAADRCAAQFVECAVPTAE